MSKTKLIGKAIVSLVESKATCPECERQILFDEIEDKWIKQDKHYIQIKCKCSRFIGITTTFKGDFVAYSLKKQ